MQQKVRKRVRNHVRLSSFLMAMTRLLPVSLQNGFLHRLDVPSSGLILAAKTREVQK